MNFLFNIFLAAFALSCIYAFLGYLIRKDTPQFREFEIKGANLLLGAWRLRWLYFKFLWSGEATRRPGKVKLLVIAARVVFVATWATLLSIPLIVGAVFFWG
jgi:hypothetical protein